MASDEDRHQYFQEIQKELDIPIAELEECYRSNESEPFSRIWAFAATANGTSMFKEMKTLGIGSSSSEKYGDATNPSSLIGCGVILDIYRNEAGEAIPKILYARTVGKLEDPELLPFQLADELGASIMDKAGLFANLDEYPRWYQRQFDQRLGVLASALEPG